MIDWERSDWGGHVTESETGSWVTDRHSESSHE